MSQNIQEKCITDHYFLKERIRELFLDIAEEFHGIPRKWKPNPINIPSLEILSQTETCHELDELALQRRIMGAFRYGRLNASNKPCFNRLERAVLEIRLYEESGNLAHLVDAYNMIHLEFAESAHPNKHFDDSKDHDRHNQVVK